MELPGHIICYDFETGNLDTTEKACQPLSLGAVAIDTRTLEKRDDFYTLMKPTNFDQLEPGAMAVNKLQIDDLKKAPEQSIAWGSFVTWAKKFNPSSSVYKAPIQAGFNIRTFDLNIIRLLSTRYKNTTKEGEPNMFHKFIIFDIIEIVLLWFHHNNELPDRKFDTLREYMGLPTFETHHALHDAYDESAVLVRFLQLKRKLFKDIPFKNTFLNKPDIQFGRKRTG